MAPAGTLAVPRFTRWLLMKSGAQLKEHLDELAKAGEVTHVVPGHGEVVQAAAAQALSQAAARLG
jgi:hypothetical protein